MEGLSSEPRYGAPTRYPRNKLVGWPSVDRLWDSKQRPAAHRVHVADRIGCRDPAIVIWVVHNRRDEVNRLNDRALFVDTIGRRIVGCGRTDEYCWILDWGQLAQDLRQVLGTDLARSPAAVRQLSQTNSFSHS